jgi:hypothetical protein
VGSSPPVPRRKEPRADDMAPWLLLLLLLLLLLMEVIMP